MTEFSIENMSDLTLSGPLQVPPGGELFTPTLVVLFLSMAVSMVVIPLMHRVAPLLGMLDKPDPRKVHSRPMARVGGWGIVIGSILSMAVWLDWDPVLQSYLLGAGTLVLFGMWDDTRDVGHYTKFLGQIIAVVPMVVHGGVYIERIPWVEPAVLPPEIGIPFSVFAMVGVINAVNHSDGLDGLAGGQTLLSLLVIGLMGYQAGGYGVAVMAMACIGAVVGFLRFNTHPARVFMGDVGSQFLGFTAGFLVIFLTQRVNTALNPAVVALLLGLPIVDILAVFAQRVYHRMNWFRGTRNHIHHRLLDLGFGHQESVIIIYAVQSLLVISAGLLGYESEWVILGLYGLVCGSLLAALTICERTGWNAGKHRVALRPWSVSPAGSARWALRYLPVLAIALGLSGYVVAGSVYVAKVPIDIGVGALALGLALVMDLVFRRESRTIASRVGVYGVTIFVVYLISQYPPPTQAVFGICETFTLIILAGGIACAVRFSLQHEFKTTTMDYLTLFVVLGISLFAEQYFGGSQAIEGVIKVVILLYGCEVLVSARADSWRILSLVSLAALFVLGVRSLAAPLSSGALGGAVERLAYIL